MLYKKTVSPGTLDLIKKLESDPLLSDFYLVGSDVKKRHTIAWMDRPKLEWFHIANRLEDVVNHPNRLYRNDHGSGVLLEDYREQYGTW